MNQLLVLKHQPSEDENSPASMLKKKREVMFDMLIEVWTFELGLVENQDWSRLYCRSSAYALQ